MRINSDTDIQIVMKAGGRGTAGADKTELQPANINGKKGFFAGNIGSTGKGRYGEMIERRRQQAQKEIRRLIGDVWESDKKLDDDISELKNKAGELTAQNKELKETIQNSEAEREALKAEYRIDDDSEEQKELELLQRAKKPVSDLSMEEWVKVGEIQARGLTDYQERSLQKYKYEEACKEKAQDNQDEIEESLGTVRATKQERLKKNPMLKAQDEAEAIAKAASDDIIGMLRKEATDHIDEEYAKKMEEAKKKAEKKEEEEELKAEREEKKEALEKHIEELTEKLTENAAGADVQKEIQALLDQLKLLHEDIKGSSVDANI